MKGAIILEIDGWMGGWMVEVRCEQINERRRATNANIDIRHPCIIVINVSYLGLLRHLALVDQDEI